MIYTKAQQESQKLDEQIKRIQIQLSKSPKGKLLCCRNGRYYKWYLSDGHKRKYLPKKQRKQAEQLALKRYLHLRLDDLVRKKRCIDSFVKNYSQCTEKAQLFLENNPEYQSLISPFFKPVSQELSEWMNSPYEKNTQYPEQLNQKTSSGLMVRSKSEAMIAHFLSINQLPFRYQSALYLPGTTIYPDFTIRHPKTVKLYYYEHFGLMDDKYYANKASNKLQLYISNGIIPSINLIITFETKENPLSIDTIEKIIKEYFL